ncbi:MAG: hypothetical protein IPJ77_22825 [Planctomycetes bacterium]|nr:hypothetical protein [Planctomycetota bacterium]
MQQEYGDQGLVVIALSDEVVETVEPYLQQNDFSHVIVGASSTAGSAYGVSGIPHSFLIGPDGNIAWHGHPSEVNKSLLKGVLKGAKKPAGGMLGVKTDFKVDPRVAKAQTLAADGKLADALKELAAIDADAKSTDVQKTDAKAVRDAITRQAESLAGTADNLAKAKDVGRALLVYDTLAKELASIDAGVDAKKKADAIRADSKLMAEFEASKAFDKLKEQLKPLATDKRKAKYEEFAKKYAGTKAGDRAKAMSRAAKKD